MASKNAPKNSSTIILEFAFERETKNTLRYAEEHVAEGERPIVGTLYIAKSALGDKQPERIHVQIDEA